MQKIFSLFAAVLVALSVTAAPATKQIAVKNLDLKKHAVVLRHAQTNVAETLNVKAQKAEVKGIHTAINAMPKLDIKFAPAKTNDGAQFDATIAVENVTATTVDVIVTPTDLQATYLHLAVPSDLIDEILAGQYASMGITTLEDFMQGEYDYYIDSLGYTADQILASGADTATFKGLIPSTVYYVLAIEFDAATGTIVGEVLGSEDFATEELQPSENEISLEFDPAASVVNVTTTNEDSYFYVLFSENLYNEWTESDYSEETMTALVAEIIAMLEEDEEGYSEYFVKAGDYAINPVNSYLWKDGVEVGNDYVAIAIPYIYNLSTINGAPVYTTFTYLEPEAPATYTNITVANADLYKAYLSNYGILDVYGWNNDSTAYAEFLYSVDDVATADYTAFTPDSIYDAYIALINGTDTTEVEIRTYFDFQVATPDDENYILECHVLGMDGNGYFVTMNFTTAIVVNDTIELAFPTRADFVDATATKGWWDAYASASTIACEISVNTNTVVGTTGSEDFDYEYTYIRMTDGYIYATPYEGNTCTVSIDGDTTIIDAYFLTESDLFFHVIMKNYMPTPTDTVALVFADGDMEDVGSGYTYYGKDEWETTGWELSFYLPSGAGTYSLDDLYNPNSYDQTYQTPCSYLVDWNTYSLINIVSANIVVAADGSFTADLISDDAVLYQLTFTPAATPVVENSDIKGATKSLNRGQLIINKGSFRFNAAGARL